MPDNRNEYEKYAREAELISRIRHRNVVQTIASWTQKNVILPEFRRKYSIDFDDESMVTGTMSE